MAPAPVKAVAAASAAGIIAAMSERPIADVPLACPFVAFEHDQARRSVEPDRRHRCYAEPVPAPRAISHQTTYCLSSGFSACPTFRAWAQRTAAKQEAEREAAARAPREVPVAPMPQAPDPATMGLVTDDARPALRGASAEAVEGAAAPDTRPSPEWAAPPPWSGDAGLDDAGDDALASLVQPRTPDPAQDADAGEVPAFLAGRPPTARGTASPHAATAPRAAVAAGAGATSGHARPVGQARPVSRGLRRPARIDTDAPAWETPRRFEAYPTLRTRVGLPRVPTIAVAAVAVLAAAVLLFVLPSIVAGPSATPTPTPRPSVATEAPVTPQPSATPLAYTIVAGDTLNKIAKKFGVTAEELLAANPQIKNPNKIQVGDEIVIPVVEEAAPETGAAPSADASQAP